MRDGGAPVPPPHPGVPWPYVDHPVGVAALQVVEHGGLVEVCQHGHVLNHVEFRGVHGMHIVLLHHPCLSGEGGHIRGSPVLTQHPKTRWKDTLTVPCWGQPWPQCLLSPGQSCPRLWGDRPRAVPAAPGHKAQLGQASPACSLLRES